MRYWCRLRICARNSFRIFPCCSSRYWIRSFVRFSWLQSSGRRRKMRGCLRVMRLWNWFRILGSKEFTLMFSSSSGSVNSCCFSSRKRFCTLSILQGMLGIRRSSSIDMRLFVRKRSKRSRFCLRISWMSIASTWWSKYGKQRCLNRRLEIWQLVFIRNSFLLRGNAAYRKLNGHTHSRNSFLSTADYRKWCFQLLNWQWNLRKSILN